MVYNCSNSGRVNYNTHNWCSCCNKKYPKDITRCLDPNCNQKLRTKTHHANASARYKARVKRLLLEKEQQILIKI